MGLNMYTINREIRLDSGERALITLKLEHHTGANKRTISGGELPRGYVSVSITGELAPKGVRYGTNASSYGQIVDALPSDHPIRWAWNNFHLNDLKAGCIHQIDAGIDELGATCEQCGYKWGSAWLVEPIDGLTLRAILSVFGAPNGVTIVTHDRVAVDVLPDYWGAVDYLHKVQPQSIEYAVNYGGWDTKVLTN